MDPRTLINGVKTTIKSKYLTVHFTYLNMYYLQDRKKTEDLTFTIRTISLHTTHHISHYQRPRHHKTNILLDIFLSDRQKQ